MRLSEVTPGEPKVIVLQRDSSGFPLTFNIQPSTHFNRVLDFHSEDFSATKYILNTLTSQLEKRTIPAAYLPLTLTTMAPSKWGTSSLETNLCALGTSPRQIFGKLQLTLPLL